MQITFCTLYFYYMLFIISANEAAELETELTAKWEC